MEPINASDRLRALASSSSQRSQSARLRDLMPDIDHAMQNGVRRTEILIVLAEAGLDMKMSYFNIARSRIKKSKAYLKANKYHAEKDDIKNNDIASGEIKQQKSLTESKISAGSDTIEPVVSNPPVEKSLRRFRNQFVDLDALAKLAPKY
jgi:hypothetical protein